MTSLWVTINEPAHARVTGTHYFAAIRAVAEVSLFAAKGVEGAVCLCPLYAAGEVLCG
jgi:hypothetical protein